MYLILGVKSPQETGLPFQAAWAIQPGTLPYTRNLCDQTGEEKFSLTAWDSDGRRCLATVSAFSCLRWLLSRGISSLPRLPVLVTGGVQRVLPCGISKPQCPHPNMLPGQPIPPTQPQKCTRSSVSETLQASINKRGVSPPAAHCLGKATAAKALTWKFTQTLSGFAIKQQNVMLLLLSLHFTSLQPPGQGHCSPVLCSPLNSRALQGQGKHWANCFNKQRQSPFQSQSCSRSRSPKMRPQYLPPFYLATSFSYWPIYRPEHKQSFLPAVQMEDESMGPEGSACFPGMSGGTTIDSRTSLTDLLSQTASKKEGQEQACCLSNL